MSPLPLPQWQTDITLGSIADLSTACWKRTEQMILREVPRPDGSGSYRLNWPLKITLDFEHEIITATNDDLDLLAYGSTEAECLNNFYSMFDDMKKHYTRLADSEIMGQAVRLKALFSSIA